MNDRVKARSVRIGAVIVIADAIQVRPVSGRGFFRTKPIFFKCFHNGVVPNLIPNSWLISSCNFLRVQ